MEIISYKNPKESLIFKLADELVSNTKTLLKQCKTEEDLRIGFEKLLEPIKIYTKV